MRALCGGRVSVRRWMRRRTGMRAVLDATAGACVRRWMRWQAGKRAALDAAAGGHACGVGCGGGHVCGVGCGGVWACVRRWMRRAGMCAVLDAAGGHVCGVGCGGGRACVRRCMRWQASYAFRGRSVPDIGITSGN